MEEKKSPASAAESAASGQPAAVPAAELRPGRRKFPTVGDLFAMLGIAFGAQIVVGTAAMVFLLFAGHGLDFKSLEPAALGKVMAALYFCSMSITLAGILCYRRARGGSGPWARFSARGLNPALLLWAFAPIFEELICRGVVLGSLRGKFGVTTAWLVSSLFFGVLHGQPVQVINATVIGLVLGYVYLATDSLWSVMILHALNNAVAYLALATGHGNALLIDLVGSRTLYVLIYIAALALSAVSGYMMLRTLRRMKEAEKNPSAA